MQVFSDLLTLYIAIAVTYVAARVWRYATSRTPVAQPELRTHTKALENAVREANNSHDLSAKLSHIQVAIKAAKNITRLLPAGVDIQEQTAALEKMRTALANEALRDGINKLSVKLCAEAEGQQRVKLGRQILALLAHEKKNRSADPELIAHYERTMQQYLETQLQAVTVECDSVDHDNSDYISDMNAVPENVHFFYGANTGELTCGQTVFDILFKINGCQVRPDDLTHDLGKSVLRTIQDSIEKRAGAIRCPEHGSAPRIVVSGHCLGDLSWEAPGCCPQLLDVVKQKLNNYH